MDYRIYKELMEMYPIISLLVLYDNAKNQVDTYYNVFTDVTCKQYDENLVLRTILNHNTLDEIAYNMYEMEIPF